MKKNKERKIIINIIQIGMLLIFILAQSYSEAAINKVSEKKAIVLAMFGTSHIEALTGILNIHKTVQQAFPNTLVKISFTSNIIRRIWQERNLDEGYLAQHKDIPAEILSAKGPLATIADLQDSGYGYIIVQPTLISSSEEFADLQSYVFSLNNIRTIKERNRPFRKILLGRPAFGTHGTRHEYKKDIEKVATILRGDVEKATQTQRALVYMAHGNDHYSTGVYLEFEHVMRKRYPEVMTYVTMVEGFPDFDVLLEKLDKDGAKKALLKPLMTVAGDHAINDMAGQEDGSLKFVLEKNGIDVMTELTGLGEIYDFANLYVDHIKDAAADYGIKLE